MAEQPLRGAKWIYNVWGGQMPIVNPPVKLSQSIYRGNLVALSETSGSVRVAVEADTGWYGVAHENVVTTATEKLTTVSVVPFASGAVFEMRGAKATMTSKPFAGVYRNLTADLEVSTTGYHRLDTGAAIKMLQIVGWHQEVELATGAGRRFYVTCNPDASQYLSTEAPNV